MDDKLLQEIYDQLSIDAAKVGISDLPVLFRYGSSDTLAAGYDLEYSNIPGGVTCSSNWVTATTNIAARDVTNGVLCYVISGHMGLSVTGMPGSRFLSSIGSFVLPRRVVVGAILHFFDRVQNDAHHVNV